MASKIQTAWDINLRTDPLIITDLHKNTLEALQRTVDYDPCQTKAFHIFTDGGGMTASCTRAKWSFCVVAEHWDGRFSFVEFIYDTVITLQDISESTLAHYIGAAQHQALDAEASAVIWALSWAAQNVPRRPVCIYIDNLLTLNAAAGASQLVQRPYLAAILRGLAHFLNRTHGVHFFHVRGHIGHPWNEFSDRAVNFARSEVGHATMDWPLHQYTTSTMAWDWLWLTPASTVEMSQYLPFKDGQLFVQYELPYATPCDTSIFKHTADDNEQSTTYAQRTFAFLNVTSLIDNDASHPHSRMPLLLQSGRLSHLLEQIKQRSISVFGACATRLPEDAQRNHGSFHIIQSSADKGNLGCMLAFDLETPITTSGSDSKYYDTKHFTPLHSESRILYVRC